MSYILDALKKAEQEREQGAVPGLHAQQVLSSEAPASAPGLSPLTWAGIGVALTLAGVLTWHNWPAKVDAGASTGMGPGTSAMDSPARSVAAPMGTGPGTDNGPGTGPDARTGDAGTPPAPPLGRTGAPAIPPRSTSDGVAMQVDGGPPAGTSRPWPAQATLSLPAPRGGEQATSQRQARSNASEGGAREAAASTPAYADLPDSLRKELPALAVGGAMHSPVRAQRMLVLNGQVLHEGDSPQPGLVLEEIRLKSAVLNYKGQRFELKF